MPFGIILYSENQFKKFIVVFFSGLTFNFLKTTYSYTGDYQWQKGSDLFGNLTLDGQTYDLGNSISNANTHNINSILDMQKFYRYLGLTKFTRGSDSKAVRGFSNANPKKTNPILNHLLI